MLAQCGGRNVKEAIKSMLSTTFKDELAVLYNWSGVVPADPHVKKRKLSTLKLMLEVIPRKSE